MSRESASLIRRADNQVVEATLLGGLTPNDLLLVERGWSIKRQEMMRELLARSVPRQNWPQSLHWDWS